MGVALALFLACPGEIDPAAFRPGACPTLTGPLAPNRALESVALLGSGELAGPEDVAIDSVGRLLSGNEDGTIRRLSATPTDAPVEIFSDTGGRPLGLDLGPDGTLWVADSLRGLVAVDPSGHSSVRLKAVEGLALGYADDVDVAPDGRVYLSDASTRFSPEQLHLEPLEARPWGRLIEFEPESGRARVLLDDLYFANGVALSEDGSFVVVAETFRYRVRRYWLRGPRKGENEVFVDNLPGFPDGVSSDGRGGFWLALFSPRVELLDRVLHPRPWLKRLIARVPAALHQRPDAYGLVVALDDAGAIVSSLHDPGGRRYPFITSVEEHDGALYLGSIEADSIGRHRLR